MFMRKLSLGLLVGLFILIGVAVAYEWTGGLNSNLQAYWSLNDTSPVDATGNHDLTNYGAVQVAGKIGNGSEFDGGTDFMNASIGETYTQISFSAWVKSDGNIDNYGGVIAMDGTDFYFRRNNNLATGELTVVGSWSVTSTDDVFDGAWHHVAGIYNGSGLELFVDNVSQGSDLTGTGGDKVITKVEIGRNEGSNSYSFGGILDEVSYWSRALTRDEVTQLASGISYAELNYTLSYNSNALYGSHELFWMNLTSSYTPTNANFVYNGTSYSATITSLGGGYYNISKDLSMNLLGTNWFNFNWYNGTDTLNTINYSQTVSVIDVDNCSSNIYMIYNFTGYNEKTLTRLNQLDIEYSLAISNQVMNNLDNYSNSFLNLSNVSSGNFAICSSHNVSLYPYFVDLIIKYTKPNYAIEYYNIQNYSTRDKDLPVNTSLYLLDNSSATLFKIIYKDSSILPRKNYLIQIQRKYVGDGTYKVVEIAKTDENGEATASFEKESVIYTFVTTKGGTVVDMFQDYLVKCQNEVLGTCEIYLTSTAEGSQPEDYTLDGDFLYQLSYNSSSRNVTATFTIPSATNYEVVLNVTTTDALQTELCSASVTSVSGTLVCAVPLSYGNSTTYVKLTKAGDLVGFGIIDTTPSPSELFGSNQVFLLLIFMISLVGLGISGSPTRLAVFMIIGVIGALAFNLIVNTGVFGKLATALWIIIAIVIIMIKGGKRE